MMLCMWLICYAEGFVEQGGCQEWLVWYLEKCWVDMLTGGGLAMARKMVGSYLGGSAMGVLGMAGLVYREVLGGYAMEKVWQWLGVIQVVVLWVLRK